MKKNILILAAASLLAAQLQAQVEPNAGNWKTWFITSGEEYRLAPPLSDKNDIAQVLVPAAAPECCRLAADHLLECRCTRIPLAGNDF